MRSVWIPINYSNSTIITIHREIISKRFCVGTTSTTPNYGTPIIKFQTNNGGNEIQLKIDENDKFLIVWFYNATYDTDINDNQILDSIMINYNDYYGYFPYMILSPKYENISSSIESYVSSKTKNKLSKYEINCLGDSFTDDNNSWERQLKNRTGIKTVHVAKGGSAIVCDYSSESLDAPSFISRINGTAENPDGGYYTGLKLDADATVIYGGLNDARDLGSGLITMGNINSNHDKTTFYGGLMLLLDNITEMIPTQTILAVIPPDFTPSPPYSTYVPLIRDAEEEVYQKYSIPYINLNKVCFAMRNNDTLMALYRKSVVDPTNYHPNEAGHSKITDCIQGFLEFYLH